MAVGIICVCVYVVCELGVIKAVKMVKRGRISDMSRLDTEIKVWTPRLSMAGGSPSIHPIVIVFRLSLRCIARFCWLCTLCLFPGPPPSAQVPHLCGISDCVSVCVPVDR